MSSIVQFHARLLPKYARELLKMYNTPKSTMTRLLVTDVPDGLAHAYIAFNTEKTLPPNRHGLTVAGSAKAASAIHS